MARYRLKTLGGLALVRCDDASADVALANSKALLILALLATRPGFSARRAELAELLWPDGDRPRALRALRQALFFLSGYADDLLIRTDESLALDPEVVTVDLWEFERAIATEDYATAVALYGGPFADGVERKVGVEVEHWIEALNARIAVGLEVAYAREIAAALSAGDGARAMSLARTFAARNPLDEARQRLLSRTLTTAGDRVGALQTLEEYRRLVSQALEEDLPPELEQRMQVMRDELLHVEAAPALPAPAAPPPPDGTEAPQAASEPVRPARRPRSRAAVFAAAGGGLATIAVIVLLAGPRGSRGVAEPLAGLEARLLAVSQRGNEAHVVELVIRGLTVAVADRNDVLPTDLPAPDGRTVAGLVQAADGWNLSVRTGTDGGRMATTAAGDEYPIAWSPDSRYLVYAERRLPADARTHTHTLAVYDLARDTAWSLAPLASAERPGADWSPDGTRIAFTADVRGTPEVFVVDFNGANLRDLTRHSGWDGYPAWSPDGEQLAFVSRRGGRTDMYAVRPDGADLRRLTRTTTEKGQPCWLSPTVLAFVAGPESGRTLQVLDAFGGQLRDLPEAEGVVALLGRREGPPSWIEHLSVEPRVELASPGQHLAVSAVARDIRGDPLTFGAIPVAWSVTDSGVARLDGPGQVRLLRAGRVGVVASLAGWRADTLTLYSVPVFERARTPVFLEDWRGGIDSTRWRVFGDPPPTTRPAGGPNRAGTFLNRGDEFFTSGAITAAEFPLAQGLGVEVDGRMPFTGKLHQEFGIALYQGDLPDSVLIGGTAPALVEFRVRGPSGAAPAEAWIATREARYTLPMPPGPDAWHAYGLQVLEDGTVELILDGRTYWRSGTPLTRHTGGVRIGLGFQSFETGIVHGRVRVYGPPRYQLPDLAVRRSGG
jgi:DNA-binding SARP family transcriptional activator